MYKICSEGGDFPHIIAIAFLACFLFLFLLFLFTSFVFLSFFPSFFLSYLDYSVLHQLGIHVFLKIMSRGRVQEPFTITKIATWCSAELIYKMGHTEIEFYPHSNLSLQAPQFASLSSITTSPPQYPINLTLGALFESSSWKILPQGCSILPKKWVRLPEMRK